VREKIEEGRGGKKEKEEEKNSTRDGQYCEMLMENQYTHKFLRWHVDSMLRACCRGIGEVRDEENYWKHITYLESHLHCKPSARGGGGRRGVGDGGGRVQATFVWLSTKSLREISQSGGEVDIHQENASGVFRQGLDFVLPLSEKILPYTKYGLAIDPHLVSL
jgi:hypothetical protein